ARARATVRAIRSTGIHVVGIGATMLAVIVFFYAPRSGGRDTIGLWRSVTHPTEIPAVIEAATIGSAEAAYGFWVTGGIQDHPYLPYLTDTLATLVAGAPAVVAFGLVGVAVDRYAGAGRDLVLGAFVAAVAATVGYPLANHFPVPWSVVHAVVPLAVPGAVGLAAVTRVGREAAGNVGDGVTDGAAVRLAVVALALVVAVWTVGGAALATSYLTPQQSPPDGGNEVVYYAQPPAEVSLVIPTMRAAVTAEEGGPDVLYHGARFDMDERGAAFPPPPGQHFARFPFPWYTESFDADVTSTTDHSEMVTTRASMVITDIGVAGPPGYESRPVRLDAIGDRKVTVHVDPAIAPPRWTETAASGP
ncbi:TIGR03663 family protein, partial [Halobacteriales archaeon SW_7_68_16]